VFHDITSGNNGGYSAGTGYDEVTGWGSYNGGAFIADEL
jgi:kumamolisin